jgi:hypothetical protein
MANVLQIGGAVLLVAGIAWLSIPAGLIAAGIVSIVIGIAVSS